MPIKKNPIVKESLAFAGDLLAERGARLLAQAIANYWIARGHRNVRAWPYEVPGSFGVWGVDSNLVGGLPQ